MGTDAVGERRGPPPSDAVAESERNHDDSDLVSLFGLPELQDLLSGACPAPLAL